jgi:signal transduction histidine kinase
MWRYGDGQKRVKFIAIPSLRWRLVTVMCLAYLIVAVSTGIVEYESQRENLHGQLRARARSDAAILAAGAVAPLNGDRSSSSVALQNFVASLRRAEGVTYASIIGSYGRIIASTVPSEVGRAVHVSFLQQSRADDLSNGNVKGIAPIAGQSTDLGIAQVVISGSSVPNDLKRSLVGSLTLRLVGLLVFLLLSLAIAGVILGPLEGLARAARAIRRGELSTRVPAEGHTELATVAQAFNSMASALEQRIRHLSFLATVGSTLPAAFRTSSDVHPVLEEFCRQIGGEAAGLLPRADSDAPAFWCGSADDRRRAEHLASEVMARSTIPVALEDGRRTLMVVPVLDDAAFVALRSEPFMEEEQQIMTNFAYQFGLAADNARLFAAQQEALQVKDQFLSIVSHELRTPLTTIKGYAQMLRRKLTDDPDDLRFATNIDAQVSRLSRLVDDLLDVTRFARGQFELTTKHTDLRAILEDVVSRFRVVSPRHTFELEIEGGPLEGEWDHDRLEQVMNNLVGNAVKYSPGGGEVVVSARRDGGSAVVSVRDEGIGISPEDRAHLFDRFYRGTAENSDIKGLGLGLYVTRRIVEAHGGTIDARSRPGEGSEFFFTLPLSQPAMPEPALRAPPARS